MKHLYGYDTEGREIVFDRKTAGMPHALVIGRKKAGKTHMIKQEIISNLLHGDREDKIIVVDTNGEYRGLGEIVDFNDTFINPCDMTVLTVDANGIADMADFLISFAEIAYGKECNAVQKSVISDVCSSMYGLYEIELTVRKDAVINRNKCPTLADFYDELAYYRKEADKLLIAVEPYCKGLFNTFAHRTNINPDSRLTIIDLSSISERRMPVALQASLMYLWSVITENSYNSARTWVYLEELHRYFRNKALADTLLQIFKCSRMRGGIITGIMQDISCMEQNEQAEFIFGNTENLILLSQNKSNAEQVKSFYHISDDLMDCIAEQNISSGLIQLDGGKFMPFTQMPAPCNE